MNETPQNAVDMDSTELRIRVAELCGWEKLSERAWKYKTESETRLTTGVLDYCGVPDYLNDLNACHEFEELLDPTERYLYRAELASMIGFSVGNSLWEILHATAEQRCRVFVTVMKRKDAGKGSQLRGT